MFEGEELVEALASTELVFGNEKLARALADCSEVKDFPREEAIYSDGDEGTHLRFVLRGRVRLDKNGHFVDHIKKGGAFGEFPILDPGLFLTVTARADHQHPTCIAKVAREDVERIGTEVPGLWKRMGKMLVQRLDNANATRLPVNEPRRMFVGSAGEDVNIIRALKDCFESDDLELVLWPDACAPSHVTIESLEKMASSVDFAALVVSQNDLAETRTQERRVPRDNVVFEAGLFMGALGRDRTFLVAPRGSTPDLPSDLFGMTLIEYAVRDDGSVDLDTAANKIRKAIENRRPVARFQRQPE